MWDILVNSITVLNALFKKILIMALCSGHLLFLPS